MSDASAGDPHASPPVRSWSHGLQSIGIIVWSSFLVACLATMVFFAVFDPLLLANDETPPAWLTTRMTGYAIGFFFFWVLMLICAWLTAYLLETLPSTSQSVGSQSKRPS